MRRYQIPQSYRILAIGSDVSRLSSRANVLTQAGYTTDIFLAIEQAVRRAVIRKYHLAIVSSSFSCEEQTAIRAQLKLVRHNLPVLLLDEEHQSSDDLLGAVAKCLKRVRLPLGKGLDGSLSHHRGK